MTIIIIIIIIICSNNSSSSSSSNINDNNFERLYSVAMHMAVGKEIYFHINPYPTAFPYGNGMVLHFYQQQESSTTKTVHKVINKGLKTYV